VFTLPRIYLVETMRVPEKMNESVSVLGQFLFAALVSICRKARPSPNLVGTPNDIREWVA
jgi:hypothetical protein